ncbi:flagellar biosynthetic protein FliO [Paenisporosarcina cavernae]|uniref:flagellar biosynthetic protein FliO n=1 Tax=Paenisporosarcina cavernae TaxID=2320858 RepID=UPI0013C4259B|nr:flagellar biosynthetic protein FliO [Paenisporosarcina cavernae]
MSFGVIAILVLVLNSTFVNVTFAEGNETVNDCIQNPDECNSPDSPAAEPSSDPAAVSLSAWDYIKMVLALLFVVALLYIVLRWINRNNRSYQRNQLVQNLGGVSIGQQKSVQVIQVGKSLLVVGVGEDISMLKEIKDEEEKATILQSFDEKQDFSTPIPYISELIQKIPFRSATNHQNETNSPQFGAMLHKRLDEIKKKRKDSLSSMESSRKEKDDQ